MMYRIGLIGCGSVARVHVDGWNKITDRAQITAVADVSHENAEQRVCQIDGSVAIYQDYRELLADPNVDAVDIILPHHLHAEAIIAAVQAGKHVLTEKPLCLNLKEAEAIATAVEQSDITMMAAHNQLFFPSVRTAKQMILNGDLGKIYVIHSLDAFGGRKPLSLNKAEWDKPVKQSKGGWRDELELSGGGELLDTGYHPTYRLLFLAGSTPTRVAAMFDTHRLSMEGEDTAHVLVRFENGVAGQIFTSWAMPVPGGDPALFHVMGEAGQLWGGKNKLYYQPTGFQTPAVTEFDGWDTRRTFAAEIEHFVDAIDCGYEPLHSVKEATDTLRLILAAYRSDEEKTFISLDSLPGYDRTPMERV